MPQGAVTFCSAETLGTLLLPHSLTAVFINKTWQAQKTLLMAAAMYRTTDLTPQKYKLNCIYNYFVPNF